VDRNELAGVHYMNPQEIKAKLEKTLHTTITDAEWAFLKDRGLIQDYEITGNWPEFRGGVEDNLKAIREFRENDRREQAGEIVETPRESGMDYQPDAMPVDLDDRTFARYSALDALNNLRSGGSAPPRATMTGTLLPRGGVDGTVPQWVYVIAAELWMPAEEVARAFRATQRSLMVKVEQPRTQARAFEVARFVWAIEAAYSRRLSWSEMCEMWNDLCKKWNDDRSNDAPMARPFENWRDFYKNFKRGERATRPQYRATDEEITEQVRIASKRGGLVAFDGWVSDLLAATVQPGAR